MTQATGEPPTEDTREGGRPSIENVARAMGTYSGDGQVDDETGGDAGAELMRSRQEERDERPPVPPAGPH